MMILIVTVSYVINEIIHIVIQLVDALIIAIVFLLEIFQLLLPLFVLSVSFEVFINFYVNSSFKNRTN